MASRNGTRQVSRRAELLRLVNDRIYEISRGTDGFEILCECGTRDCFAQLELTVSEYRQIRGNGSVFLVVPGHEPPGVDHTVVAERGSYRVVALGP